MDFGSSDIMWDLDLIDPIDTEIFDLAYDAEYEHHNGDRNIGDYLIGNYSLIDDVFIVSVSISTALFYQKDYEFLFQYVSIYSTVSIIEQFVMNNMSNNIILSYMYSVISTNIDILKIVPDYEMRYTVVVKTFWLRLIQRNWKRVFRERKKYIQYQSKLSNLYKREKGELTNRRQMPGITGMLCSLKSNTTT